MADYTTELGSLDDYRKGGVHIINDDPRNYVFSNVFEVAGKSAPFERVCVAKNLEYSIEIMRVDGASPWFAAGHDEFALCLDGQIVVELMKHGGNAPEGDGAVQLEGEPEGPRMGRIRAGRGHLTLLPANAAYRFSAEAPSVVLFQTMEGPLTIERWAEICQTGEE